jgi:hypothetical protein
MSAGARTKTKLRRTVIVGAALAAFASAAACQLLAGIEDDHFTVAPDGGGTPAPPDGSSNAPPEASAPVDLCPHRVAPPPPSGITGGVDNLPYVIAVDHFDFSGLNDAGAAIGFDLDHACTCFSGLTDHEGGASCTSPNGASNCDEEGGIDNGIKPIIELFAKALQQVGDLGATQQRLAHCGREALILVLRNYNGLANDDTVSLGPLISNGIVELLPDSGAPTPDLRCTVGLDAGVDGGDLTFTSKADGTDVWSHSQSALTSSVPGDPVPSKLFGGYVSNWILVVTYRDEDVLPLSFGATEIDVRSGVLTAELVPLDANNAAIPIKDGVPESNPVSFGLQNGVLAGRVNASQFVGVAGVTPMGLSDGGDVTLACNDPNFMYTKALLCENTDIPSKAQSDFTNVTCDAISVVLGFTGTSAHLGTVTREPVPPPSSSTCPVGYAQCP